MELNCKFSDVSERDMDMFFLEEIIASQDFVNIFLEKVGEKGAKVIEVEHSKVDSELGESDMTVVVLWKGEKHALLIEDKIDAPAMEKQCERYIQRGNRGIEEKIYDKFYVFIVAPQKYLCEDKEAKEYHNQVTYEECREYFAKKEDKRSLFKLQQINLAIEKQKKGYQVQENIAVTEYWKKYVAFQREYYPGLDCANTIGPKGGSATWPQFRVNVDDVCIFHKAEKGVVDLNFYGAGEKTNELERELRNVLGNLEEQGLVVRKTGKSAVLRKEVHMIDFKKTFEESIELKQCFDAIIQLQFIAKEKIDWKKIKALI